MTLKAFKAAIKPGMQIRVSEHWIQTHRFTQNGDPKRFWSDFPKASQLHFDGSTARVTIDGKRHWTLHLLS